MLLLHASLEGEALLVWAETSTPPRPPPRRPGRRPRVPKPDRHPFAAEAEELGRALASAGVPGGRGESGEWIAWLPGAGGAPAASSRLIAEPPEPGAALALAPWTVPACRLSVAEAAALLLRCVGQETLGPGLAVGKDLALATLAFRAAGSLVARQRFLPGLREEDGGFRAVWEPVIDGADAESLAALAEAMPDAGRALHRKGDAPPAVPARPLIDRFVAAVVDHLVREAAGREDGPGGPAAGPARPRAPRPERRARAAAAPSFDSPHDAWVHGLRSPDGRVDGPSVELARLTATVNDWRRRVAARVAAPFRLSFRLEEPAGEAAGNGDPRRTAEPDGDDWRVRYLLQGTRDPSLLVPAEQVWKGDRAAASLLARAGLDAREHLLASLGQAAGVDPAVEASLRGRAPSGHRLDASGAYAFLGERSIALEQAGFGVLLPAWWTRKGTKGRITAKAVVRSPKLKGGGGLGLDDLVRFEWQVALGDEPLSLAELRALARLKAPLVRVRGQWVQMSAAEIEAALAFWKKKGGETARVRDVVRMALGAGTTPGGLAFAGVEADGWVGDLLSRLETHAGFEELDPPARFRGTLRPYQARGYSWLAFLGRCGFGACLADDMGLGKTVQALALVARHRAAGEKRPVLLVCPTSVVGNWEKEAARFTPGLPVMVHHGVGRTRGSGFRREAETHAVVLSSYALLHRDQETLKEVPWAGVVLDEAQNVKNPETKQARAARSLPAGYRVALTGTPVENNVGDLWSLMEFLNPGLLGTQAEFRRRFFVPIQAGRDPDAMDRLRRLTGPFILRRLKTDKTVIADLPEKMEMKVFCTLTREQASLYAAVVAEAEEELVKAEGIRRKGLVLATLSKLKQVCNHPAQFLGDNSEIGGRSGKLARLTEMLEEALAEGDRALVFSQFSEMGEILRRHLQETFGREALFLHGGVPRGARDRMVERFQAEEDGPRLFVLSLKAGGTGLNLTRASHVFHFDRWWNPAVESQATDRAFRIGQTRRVQVHKLVCAGTLEEKIDEMIERKREVAERIVGTGEGWLTELSTAELREVFALRADAVES